MTELLTWRKARASAAQGGCVEVAMAAVCVHVRDTRSRERGVLIVSRDTWEQFVTEVKSGGFAVS